VAKRKRHETARIMQGYTLRLFSRCIFVRVKLNLPTIVSSERIWHDACSPETKPGKPVLVLNMEKACGGSYHFGKDDLDTTCGQHVNVYIHIICQIMIGYVLTYSVRKLNQLPTFETSLPMKIRQTVFRISLRSPGIHILRHIFLLFDL